MGKKRKWDNLKVHELQLLKTQGKSIQEIADALGVSYYSVAKASRRYCNFDDSSGDIHLVDIGKVRERYDIDDAILRGVNEIPEGKLILETEFIRLVCHQNYVTFHRYINSNESKFSKYRLKLKLDYGDPKWYWGRESTIKEAKRIKEI